MNKNILFLLLLFIFIPSCTETPKNDKKDILAGSWIFDSGTKNGNLDGIELLNKLVFEFSDKTFSCELLPEMHEGLKEEESYLIKEDNILVGNKFNMEIIDLSENILFLKFNIILGEETVIFDLKFNRQL